MVVLTDSAREVFRHDRASRGFGWARLCSSTTSLGPTTACTPIRRAEVLRHQPGSGEAARLVGSFCEAIPATRVAPTQEELERLWTNLAHLAPAVVADALHDQLLSAGDHWQVQLRALRFIAYLYNKGTVGRAIASMVMAKASKLIKHLSAEVPPCQDDAGRVLLIWQLAEILPPGQEVPVADDGGLLHFTTATRKAPRSSEESKRVPPEGGTLVPNLKCHEPLIDLLSWSPPAQSMSPLEPPAQAPAPTAARAQQPVVALTMAEPQKQAQALDDLNFLAEALAAVRSEPEEFHIGDGDVACENSDLTDMFSFRRLRRAPSIPLLNEKTANQHVPQAPDPFAALASHISWNHRP